MVTQVLQGFKVSPQQRRVWKLLQQHAGPDYCSRCSLIVDGELEPSILAKVLAGIVERHEILRTRFQVHGGMEQPLQVILSEADFIYNWRDLSRLAENDKQAERERLLQSDVTVEQEAYAPSLRVTHLILNRNEHLLMLDLPSLCADAVSLHALARQLIDACSCWPDQPTDQEPVQYADIAETFNRCVESEEFDFGRMFWREQLGEKQGEARPRFDRASEGFRPRWFRARLTESIAEGLSEFCRQSGATREGVLLTCWALLMCRLRASREVMIGVSCDGRTHKLLKDAMGPLSRHVPMSFELRFDDSFKETVRSIDLLRAQMEESQHYYDPATRESDDAPSLRAYDVCFEYLRLTPDTMRNDRILEIENLTSVQEEFEIKLTVIEAGSEAIYELEYDASAVSETEVERMWAHYTALLESGVRQASKRSLELEMMSADERQAIFTYSTGEQSELKWSSVTEMFSAQVAQHRDAVAVVYEDDQLSYGELDRRSNRLAHHLIAYGVGPDVRVGILMSRGIDVIVGLMGVLKAGAAYVPMEESNPPERLGYMMEDAQAKVVISEGRLKDRVKWAKKVVSVDEDWEEISERSEEAPQQASNGDDLAYVIYTSGTTGRPKGVGVEHQQVVNYVEAISHRLRLEAGWRMALVSTIAADLGHTMTYASLCLGGELHVVSQERSRDSQLWQQYQSEREIECVKMTPSHVEALIRGGKGVVSRRLVLGGESLSRQMVEAIDRMEGGCEIYNHYGPTECTVGAVAHEVKEEEEGEVAIGKPLRNVTAYVIDISQGLVPVGVAGELYIGGKGVARGYIGDAEQTAERFVPDGYNGEAGARLYRTGDLVRRVEDGELQYVGRIDNQVKIRGYRVELGEIEAALKEHPIVKDAVVVAREDEPGDKRLAAYVALKEGFRPDNGHRLQRLPNSMSIVEQSKVETQYQYKEIFEEKVYLRHGITLRPGACVFDVGANIGMFTIYVGQKVKEAKVYAFEPVKTVYDALKINASRYAPGARVMQIGLGESQSVEKFTYYPEYSSRSGLSRYADVVSEVEVTKRYMGKMASEGVEGMQELLKEADEYLSKQFEWREQECEVRRLSDVIRQEGIERIDLLKVDVQKAEMDVLRGIDERDWEKIEQVVMEVHDEKGGETEGRLEEVVRLLSEKGHEVKSEQQADLEGTDRYVVYGVRRGRVCEEEEIEERNGEEIWQAERCEECTVEEELKKMLRERMPEYMMPAAVVVMESMPLTSNGKIDRGKLPRPEKKAEGEEKARARTEIEEIVKGIWEEVLRVGEIGINENFFEVGGHSLLATQVMSRVREVFNVDMALRSLFESPTVEAFAMRVQTTMMTGQQAEAPPLERVSRDRQLPLSFAQQRLWFIQQLEPDSPLYNIPHAVRLRGELDLTALSRSLADIVARHEVLRTRFVAVDGQPMQVIDEPAEIELPVSDLSDLEVSERQERAREIVGREARRAFDLEQGPVWRAVLVKLGQEEHVLMLTIHHIASDGWSTGVLVREFGALYEQHSGGKQAELPELAVQYADYAVWQREWLTGEVLDQQMSYWRKQLQGAPVLELPTDRPRPAVASHRGARGRFEVSGELTEQVKALSRQHGVSLFMTLLATLDVLLFRYSGQEDICVGSPIANRNRKEIEGLIGFFANTLVLRAGMEGAPPFEDLLKAIREVALDAYNHQDVPFEKLVEELQPDRSLSYSPLFQVMFVLQNTPAGKSNLPGLVMGPFEAGNNTAKFDLVLSLHEGDRGLSGGFEYDATLFDRTTVERFTGNLVSLLGAVVARPNQKITLLPLLSEAERLQLVFEWNDTGNGDVAVNSLIDLFNRQAKETKDSIALIFQEEHLSYYELNRQANLLGGYLQRLGVGPEAAVGICMERSVEMAVALLAVLKSGAAYLPLDPAYPPERLSFMVEDARASLVLSQQHLAGRLPGCGAKIICLDECGCADADQESEIDGGALPDNLAYIIYTSGSTGLPKGVGLPNRALTNLIEWHRSTMLAGVKVLQFASLSFDASIHEFFAAWSTGGAILLIPDSMRFDVPALLTYISEKGIEKLILPVVVLQQMAELHAQGNDDLRFVKEITTTGEQLQISTPIVELFTDLDHCPLHNHYGPSESHVVTAFTLDQEPRSWSRHPSIGKPITNTQIYLLDSQMSPVPLGVPGELYIGGVSLARGYWARPELTVEKFVPDPLGTEPGARLYRTGDLARYLMDGNIEYSARIDHQVKVRGFRIELGEIEAVLSRHEAIKEIVVLAREDEPGRKQLVAYVVSDSNASLSSNELRRFLTDKLPDYMLPSVFITIDKMPLTANGKIDRRALPRPEIKSDGEDSIDRNNAVEEILSGIWAEVLKLASVGAEQNFFELGGHSLLATQVISRVREAFDVEVPLKALFESPTVAGLGEAIDRERRAGRRAEAPPIEAVSRARQLPVSFAQQRLWFIHQLDPDSAAYNIARAVRLKGGLDLFALKQSLQAITCRHEVLRTRFVAVDGQPLQVIDEPSEIELPVWDLSDLEASQREERAREIVGLEARRAFDLERGPVWRAALLKLSAHEHALMLTIHHIASDGWSMGVLVREFGALYEQHSGGKQADLPELEVQYADYAVWQREWLRGEVLDQQMSYWRGQLEGAAVLELPTDRPRPAVATHRGATLPFSLSAELTHQLRQVSRQRGVTVFMTLLTAFQVVLSRYSGQDDVVVGTDVANRNRMETEPLIGFFINQLVLRADLSANPTFKQLLASIRETTLSAYEHQDVPFEKLVEELQPDRDLGRSPLFQVKLVLQNAPRGELRAAGVEFNGFGAEHTAAKFDITLFLTESSEGVAGVAEYATDMYDGVSIERLVGHLRTVIEAMLSDTRRAVSEVSLLSESEAQQLVVEWNNTARRCEEELCLHELFERQARTTPDAVAVVDQQGVLSYKTLDDQANRLAHFLRSHGVNRESLVAVMLERSSNLIVATLGILKAGAAYMPIDPDYPFERVLFMLNDGGVSFCIAIQSAVERLRTVVPSIFSFDSYQAEINAHISTAPAHLNNPSDLAYCIYTSGSTGRPNGAMIQHRNVTRLMMNDPAELKPSARDVWTMFHSYCFDFSVWEMYGALLFGGKVIVVPDDVRKDPTQFANLIIDEGVTVLSQTPSYFNSLMPVLLSGGLATLPVKHIIFGAEALRPVMLKPFMLAYPETKMINMYGITETTVHVTYHEVSDADTENSASNIGTPIPTTTTYVFDKEQNPVAIQVIGEMYVGGEGLARGYLNRPELTAERFRPDGISGAVGERLYKTGDLARYKPDGRLEYVGRRDHQIKMRGYRIELAEIESVLAKHNGVKQCAVLAREDAHGGKRLVAYVVPSETGVPLSARLQSYLQTRLPDYMVPSLFVELSSLPLTPNGKLDRKALPAPAAANDIGEELRSPVEELLCAIWSDVLQVENVGVKQNFFELGGHSLLATQVISRVREAFDVEVPLKALFESPTVAGLGEAVDRERRAGRRAEAPPIVSVSRARQLPVSFAQQRLWFIHQLDPDSAAYNVPIAVRLRGELDLTALSRSLADIVARHEVLRTRFVAVDGQPMQVIDEPSEIELPVSDLSDLEVSERQERAREIVGREARRAFDLEQGPVWRAVLIKLGEEEHVLMLTIHHIASDGWSTGVLVREFGALYEQHSGGKQAELPELAVQYADYAVWQREWLTGEVLDQQMSYWREQLEGAPVMELPTDRPRPLRRRYKATAAYFALDPNLSEMVKDLARREGVTLFMLLLAAFKGLLHRYSGQDDLCVGAPIAGRDLSQVRPLVGLFVNTLVLRTIIPENPTFQELLKRVRQVCLEAYARPDIPFEKLVAELQQERDLSYHPLFQVWFVLQNIPASQLRMKQVELSKLRTETQTTNFDLTFAIAATDRLAGSITYDTELFDPETIAEFLRRYETLLTEIVSNPQKRLLEIELDAGEATRPISDGTLSPLSAGLNADFAF